MKRYSLLLLFWGSLFAPTWGQFPIGHQTLVFNDPARNNRPVQTEIYYPAAAEGDDQPIAAGSFPVVAFGHGFVMSASAYANVWSALVPQGYIVCLPTTEGSFAPSHESFGQDLAFLVGALQEAGNTAGSFWENRVGPRAALMGHSMGGGAALLGTPLQPAVTVTAVFAPAETTPSAVAACAQIEKPVLIFTGSQDCITPTANHAAPMYAALDAACKVHVDLDGGNHCYFADFNFNCNFGEATTGCQPGISREQQHERVLAVLLPWFDFYLKEETGEWPVFQNALTTTPGLAVAQTNCAAPLSSHAAPSSPDLRLSPNPAGAALYVRFDQNIPDAAPLFTAVDSAGRATRLPVQAADTEGWRLDVSGLPAGAYRLQVQGKERVWSAGFVKAR